MNRASQKKNEQHSFSKNGRNLQKEKGQRFLQIWIHYFLMLWRNVDLNQETVYGQD